MERKFKLFLTIILSILTIVTISKILDRQSLQIKFRNRLSLEEKGKRQQTQDKQEVQCGNDEENITCGTEQPVFLDKPQTLVALASFPGSGNSWTRQIIESVTGIYTGSEYTDSAAGFEGSKRCPTDGSTFIIKTHSPAMGARPTRRFNCSHKIVYGKAILILRNPFDTFIAEFNRRKAGKTGLAKQKDFASPGMTEYVRDCILTPDWRNFVIKMAWEWKRFVLYWLKEFERPTHVLVYERLQSNTVKEIYKVLKFVNFTINFKALVCLNEDGRQEKYYRAKKPSWLTKDRLFDDTLKLLVNNSTQDVYKNITDDRNDVLDVLKNYALV